ncbi:hypothetical protein F5141DRAFT_1210672 [Pisolithus sp. B1]|nr:hypothetical protein F5141DRAFT_1210672 [Pisolithus sp. B1]
MAPNFLHHHCCFLVYTLNLKPKLKPATLRQISISQWLEPSQRNVVSWIREGIQLDVWSSLGRSKIRAGNFPSIPKTPGMAPPGGLARMRRFFRRSGQDSSVAIVTEVTDTQAGGVPQAAATCAGGGAQEQQEQLQAAPTEDVAKSVAKPEPEPKSKLEPEPKPESKLEESKPKPEAELTLALAGQHVDAAVKVFGGDDPISGVAKGAADAVGIVDTAFSGIQTLREMYLKPF